MCAMIWLHNMGVKVLLDMTYTPFVSVVIPCFNEEEFIAQCLDSIIANDYDKGNLEILVVDGLSTDHTRVILQDYQRKHSFIKVIDNPAHHKPHALNLGIQSARGAVIIRMDAHAIYRPDYISKCIQYLEAYGADNVGGVRLTSPRNSTRIGRAIAQAISHPFAAGNATYRTGAREIKWVDTVFGGCYRREVFDKIGLFNEALIRGQDREFNVRLTKAGGRILFVPDIVCEYFVRSNLKSYIPWTYVGGLTPFYISRITRKPIFSWRNLIPLCFVLVLAGILLLSLFYSPFLWIFGGIVGIYLVASVIASFSVVRDERDGCFLILMPFIFAITHITYGIGSLMGFFKPIRRQSEWSKV